MKTHTANTEIQTDKNFFTDLFVESGLSILGFLLLLLLIV